MTAAVTPSRDEISAIIADWFPGKQSFRDRCADAILTRLAAKPAEERVQEPGLLPDPKYPPEGYATGNAVDWAVSRWKAEVANRPLQNVHRAGIDGTWRQVIRHFGGNDIELCGADHYELVALSTKEEPKPPTRGDE